MIAARVAKLRIAAPTDGVVVQIVAEAGEAVVPDEPVMALGAAGQRRASFNLREDQLGGLRLGSGRGSRSRAAETPSTRVDQNEPRGEFATWRAARVVGDHDVNTFLVRADPASEKAPALQPGTVWRLPAAN